MFDTLNCLMCFNEVMHILVKILGKKPNLTLAGICRKKNCLITVLTQTTMLVIMK